jgi:hypothetical protein
LNKQRQILVSLGKLNQDKTAQKVTRPQTTQNAPGNANAQTQLPDYKLYTVDEIDPANCVTILNWLQILENESSREVLDLWLKPEAATPSVHVSPAPSPGTQATPSAGVTQQPTGGLPSASISLAGSTVQPPSAPGSTGSQSSSSPARPPLGFVPEPFLTWPLIDDFGEHDKRSELERAMAFLDDIYENMSLSYAKNLHKLVVDSADQLVALPGPSGGSQASPPILSAEEVLKLVEQHKSKLKDQDLERLNAFVQQCRHILQLFAIPASPPAPSPTGLQAGLSQQSSSIGQDSRLPKHPAVLLFWSFAGEIVRVSTNDTPAPTKLT